MKRINEKKVVLVYDNGDLKVFRSQAQLAKKTKSIKRFNKSLYKG